MLEFYLFIQSDFYDLYITSPPSPTPSTYALASRHIPTSTTLLLIPRKISISLSLLHTIRVYFGVYCIWVRILSCFHLVNIIQGLFCSLVSLLPSWMHSVPHTTHSRMLCIFLFLFDCCADNCRLVEISHSLTVFQSVYTVFFSSPAIGKRQSFTQQSLFYRATWYLLWKIYGIWWQTTKKMNKKKCKGNNYEYSTTKYYRRKSNILLDCVKWKIF